MHHVAPHPHHHSGFCHSCCHPVSKCCCGHRTCHKVPKELLAMPAEREIDVSDRETLTHLTSKIPASASATASMFVKTAMTTLPELANVRNVGIETAIIGGGCCVHLSIEYMAAQHTLKPTPSLVAVTVEDSEGTILAWGKQGVFSGYTIKEGIISTNPGAKLQLLVMNATARVRWCEVFSC